MTYFKSVTANYLANLITVSRIVLTFIFALCLFYASEFSFLNIWAKLTFIVIILSDCIDGAIAKRWGKPTLLGSLLDPLADKISIDISFIVISIKYDFPVWPTIVIVSRDLFVLGAWYFYLFVEKKDFMAVPHLFGKIMVSAQMITILFVILQLQQEVINMAWWISIIFSIASFLIYAISLHKNKKGIFVKAYPGCGLPSNQ